MRFFVLDKNDTWAATINKLEEESKEASESIFELYTTINKDPKEIKRLKQRAASELFDCIQVCVGGLYKLSQEGLSIERELMIHRQKLLRRGWAIKSTYRIIKTSTSKK